MIKPRAVILSAGSVTKGKKSKRKWACRKMSPFRVALFEFFSALSPPLAKDITKKSTEGEFEFFLKFRRG
jgi:hypothetical protein